MFLCAFHTESLFGIQQLGFISPCIASSARLDRIHPAQVHLIGIRVSPDHRRVDNKELKFIIMNLLSGGKI